MTRGLSRIVSPQTRFSDHAEVNSGLAFILGVLIVVSGIFAVLLVFPHEEGEENAEENPWVPIPYYPYIDPLFSGIIAEHFLEMQLDFGYRVPGTPDHAECRDFIRDTMKEFGYDVEYQEFTWNGTQGTNIIARKAVSDIYRNDTNATNDNAEVQTLILGAHYDTRPYTGKHTLENIPIMGANDGGSGVAVLLELARVLTVHPVNLNIEFVFFDLEDSGILRFEYAQGSKVYAESLTDLQKETILGAVVVDMIGDADLNIYFEKNSDQDMMDDIWKEADKLDYKEFHHIHKYSVFDDHVRLKNVGIPAVDIIDFDYEYWHTQEDTLDKVSGDSLEKVGRVLERYIYTLSSYRREKPAPENLTILEGTSETLSNRVFQVNGDMDIKGTLKLEDAFLIVNSEEGFEHLIKVHEEGKLIVDNSVISSPKQFMIFENHGELIIRNSTVEQLWGNTQDLPHPGGIQLYSPDFTIVDSTIQYSASRGIFVRDVQASPGSIIESSRIVHNGEVGLYSHNSSVEVRDTLFEGNGRGALWIGGGGFIMSDSTIGYCEPEGTCTDGSCSGPEPTYGIELLGTSGNVVLTGVDFKEVEKGIVASYGNDSEGSLTVDSVTMEAQDWGIELLSTPAVVRNSQFNDTQIALTLENSHANIQNNSITNSLPAIRAKTSTGDLTDNVITNNTYYGIYLDRSTMNLRRNTVKNSDTGVWITDDRGSTLDGNTIHQNNYGLELKVQETSNTTIVSNNTIFGNEWGIYCLGNNSRAILDSNEYQSGAENNTLGNIIIESEIRIEIHNNSAGINITISREGEAMYQKEFSKWSHTILANVTIYIQLVNGTEQSFTAFQADISSGDSSVIREIDILDTAEVIIDFNAVDG